MSTSVMFEKVVELADASTKRLDPTKLKWQWGEALYTYALYLLDEALGEDRYLDFYRAYMDAHIARGFRVDQSDTAAPALTAYALYLKTGEVRYREVVDRVVNYMKTTPRILDYMPNHLGNSPESWLYPKSVWVDSVMMYGVFTSWYGRASGDQELYDFARKQPNLFAQYLQDPTEKLFYHSYWVNKGCSYPKNKLFWGRGNGWVIAGLPKAIENFADNSDEKTRAIAIVQETSAALLPYQRKDGFFETVFNKPGKTYIESSATALIAGGWLQGLREGYLDDRFREPALRAFRAVVDCLEYKDGLLSMPLISGPTIPLQLIPYLGYKLTPRRNDWEYGLASLLFAGINYKKLIDSEAA
ncbi:glycoside hydrolase family 88 protein [Simiduia curdlanivorans]|uniref:Glycoside hydrolase family 88 protein n=1 Tax=Simiduia curdlanivorans TaxID=1492769 RepID=A0ABV8V958_9GAMM|nr:glycoside hydrolase family 88 protein [Simiduia curdlanivorans]MDN3639716.1 glycoside hydrolase family 88 protein [Simiduia curdlanivorans]